MAGEDSVHVAHFVNDEDAEGQAQQPGARRRGRGSRARIAAANI